MKPCQGTYRRQEGRSPGGFPIRLVVAIGIVLLLAPLPASPAAAAAPIGQNLVANSGFEDGSPVATTPPGWTVCCGMNGRAERLPLLAHNGSYALQVQSRSGELVSVLRSTTATVEGGWVLVFGGWLLEVDGVSFRVDFYQGSTYLTSADASTPGIGLDWTESSGRVVVPPRATRVQLVIAATGEAVGAVDDAYVVVVAGNLFTEEFSNGLAGWSTTAAGASGDCSVAVNGCSLRVDPPYIAPGSRSASVGSWSSANTWYNLAIMLDFDAQSTFAELRTQTGTLLARSSAIRLGTVPVIDHVRFAANDYSGVSHAFSHDDLFIGEVGGARVFQETWDAGLGAWGVTGSGATSDCANAVTGCALALDPPCCGEPVWVTRSLNISIPSKTEVSFMFRSTSTSGSSDDDFSITFTDGNHVIYHLTDPPGNNQLTLVACCAGSSQPLWVTRGLNLTLPTLTETSFFYQGSTTGGSTDADFSMTFGDGSYAIVRLTDTPGNNMVSLETSAGGKVNAYAWPNANQWYRIVLRLDFGGDTARVEVRDYANDALLATSGLRPMTSGPTVDFVRFASADYSSTTAAFHHDRLVIRADAS